MTALTTCAVTITVLSPGGGAVGNAVVLAQLSERLVYHGIVIPDRVVGRTDATGVVVLNLFPNVLVASPVTHYNITIATPDKRVEHFTAVVPNKASTTLSEISGSAPPAGTGDDVARMLATLAEIEKKVRLDAASVASAKTSAMVSKLDSASSATAAASSATAAAASATAAAASEGKTKIDSDAAAASATLAQTHATGAENAKHAAQSSALQAGVSASNALTHENNAQTIYTQAQHLESVIAAMRDQVLHSIQASGQSGATITHVVAHTAFQYIATDGQTEFTGNDLYNNALSYSPGKLFLFLNGVILRPGADYSASDGSKVELTFPAAADDWLMALPLSDQTAGGGTGGGVSLPIAMSDVTGLVSALAAKFSSAHLPSMADVTGLDAALTLKFSPTNQPDMSQVTGLTSALSQKYGPTNQPSSADVTGLSDDLALLFGPLNNPTMSDVTGLDAALAQKYGPSNAPSVENITGLQDMLNQFATNVNMTLSEIRLGSQLYGTVTGGVPLHSDPHVLIFHTSGNLVVHETHLGAATLNKAFLEVTLVGGGGSGGMGADIGTGGGGGEVVTFTRIVRDGTYSVVIGDGGVYSGGSSHDGQATTLTIETDVYSAAGGSGGSGAHEMVALGGSTPSAQQLADAVYIPGGSSGIVKSVNNVTTATGGGAAGGQSGFPHGVEEESVSCGGSGYGGGGHGGGVAVLMKQGANGYSSLRMYREPVNQNDVYEYVATAGETTFSGVDTNGQTLSYIESSVLVLKNGAQLVGGIDYTATDGTSVVLTSGASAGDQLAVYASERAGDGEIGGGGGGSSTALGFTPGSGGKGIAIVRVRTASMMALGG